MRFLRCILILVAEPNLLFLVKLWAESRHFARAYQPLDVDRRLSGGFHHPTTTKKIAAAPEFAALVTPMVAVRKTISPPHFGQHGAAADSASTILVAPHGMEVSGVGGLAGPGR
jgi:hypothetical protein